ncbi:hypothetical protein JVT61DRAFT_12075 [Boletus reticuloceps]|uniref:Uncharacterized protein n=1 Tax=Boletus reticuloceps TaxID=495285 RepID=A0A8I2YES7_9AGAM|nr:hypothetical protein JVT61DRAFT_12075 [Boletus reticuloceps]
MSCIVPDGQAMNVSPSISVLVLSCLTDGIRWGSMMPLRQFKGVPQEVIRKAEGKHFPWYFNLQPPELGGLISIPDTDKLIYRLVHNSPKLQQVPSPTYHPFPPPYLLHMH